MTVEPPRRRTAVVAVKAEDLGKRLDELDDKLAAVVERMRAVELQLQEVNGELEVPAAVLRMAQGWSPAETFSYLRNLKARRTELVKKKNQVLAERSALQRERERLGRRMYRLEHPPVPRDVPEGTADEVIKALQDARAALKFMVEEFGALARTKSEEKALYQARLAASMCRKAASRLKEEAS